MNKKKLYILLFFVILSPLFYFGFVFKSVNLYNLYNIIIFLFSGIISILSFFYIKKNGFAPHNIFLFTFYTFLFWDTSNSAEIQARKELIDIYYYFFGPLIFTFILWLSVKIPVKRIKINLGLNFDNDLIIFILLVVYVLLKLYIGSQVGYRITSVYDGYLLSGEEFSIPIYTGIATALQWTLLMFVPYVKKKHAVLIIAVIIIFAYLHVKRGDISRVFIFLLIFYLYNKVKVKSSFSLKKTGIIILVLYLFSVIFANFGEWRRHNQTEEGVITEQLDSRVNNLVYNWMYSYTTMGYEVVRKTYIMEHPNYPYGILTPYMSNSSYDYRVYQKEQSEAIINGFNAGTFLSLFIHDYGELYFIELFLFGFILFIIIMLIRIFDFKGMLFLLLSFIVFFFFGNMFSNTGVINSFILSIFIFILLKNKNINYFVK